ncbi:MAG: carboxypeptidase-like regulatory domain-containing protein [Bacteroidales bacterium]
MMTRFKAIIILFFGAGTLLFGQQVETRRFVQVDGIVTDETNYPLRYVNIVSKSLATGTMSDANGIFSLISLWGDTLIFTSVGFKPALIKLPDRIPAPGYSIDVELKSDTINIGPVLVLPWKTYEDFKRAVVEYVPAEEELRKNLEENLAIIENQIYADITISPEAGYRYAMQRETENVMTRNQTPVNNILNPFAWAKFIDGLKNGLLKNKKSKKKAEGKSKESGSGAESPDSPFNEIKISNITSACYFYCRVNTGGPGELLYHQGKSNRPFRHSSGACKYHNRGSQYRRLYRHEWGVHIESSCR